MSVLSQKDPFTGKLIGEYPLDSMEQVNKKISSLHVAQNKWKALPIEDRIHGVQKAMQYFSDNREQIAMDICQSIGRPFHQSTGEVSGFFERAEYLCSIAKNSLQDDNFEDKPGFKRKISHEPIGLVFVISAWNYPLLITVNSVIPALISGNAVLLKHSSLTPSIGAHFEKAFSNINGIGPLLSQTICSHEVSGKVIESSAIDHVVFTGSVAGGKTINQHCSTRFLQPVLELGGKDAAYVHTDANIKKAAAGVVDGAMFNSGQACCGIERAYVHEKVYDEFINEAKKIIESYVLGDPKDKKTQLGPLAQAKSIGLLQQQIDEAQSKGAKIICGGQPQKIQQGVFWQPTLIVDVDHSMSLMSEENFGPILPVMKVKDEKEAIEKINDSKFGLTTALFTSDLALAEKMAPNIESGTVYMNRCDYLDPALPWAGRKSSGVGYSLSKYSFKSFTRTKSTHFKLQP